MNEKPGPPGENAQSIHLTGHWAPHRKGTGFPFVQLILVEPAHYLFLHKSTHEFQSRDQEEQNQEVQTNQWGYEGGKDPAHSGEHGARSKANVPGRRKKEQIN